MKVDKSKWVESTLGYCLISLRTGLNPRLNFKLNEPGSNNYYITVRELNGRGLTITDKTDKFPDYAFPLINNRSNLEVGDVLFTGTGTIGKTALVSETPQNWNIKEGVYALKPNSELIDSEYLLHYLHSINLMEFCRVNSKGATIQSVPMATLKKAPIILPPLDKQQGIAKELDTLQIMIDGYKAQLYDLDELIKSIFNNTFGDIHSNPYNFDIKLMQDVCSKITDGTHNPPKFVESGIPFIFVSNIANYEISYLAKKHIDDASYNELWKSTPVEVGDIVYTSVGSYGNPAIVRTDKKFMFQRHIALLKPKHDIIESEYLKWFLISPSGKEQADNKAIGAAQKTLNLKAIKTFKILVPPKDKQQNFTAQVEVLEKQRALLQEQLADAEQLMAERMQFYFS